MTYTPIPEERRRELAAFIPDLAEARRRWEYGLDAPTEPQFWTKHILGIRAAPTRAAERLWLLRHAHLAAVGTDPTQVSCFAWPGFCARTGRNATEEDWPLEPIPGAKVPPKEPPKATPGPKRTVARAGVNPLGLPRVWFTNDFWRDPTDLTFVAPTKRDDCSVVIEGRVVKPGDTIFVRPGVLAPGDDPKRTVRRVEVNGYDRRVWFTTDRWRHPTDLTFGASALRQAPSFDFGDPTTITDSDVKRTSLQVFSDYMKRRAAELATPQIIVNPAAAQQLQQLQQFHTQIQAALTPSKLENTMTQATAFNADSLTVDTSNIVETKTFVFGRDITTLDDNDLLGNIQLLDQKIDKLEAINAKTPLVKLVTKIVELLGAKAKIVELLGGAPVEQASAAVEADKAAPIPLTPPPASKALPIELRYQDPFVAIVQVDGAGEDRAIPWVLVRQDELDNFIARLQAMKQ